MICKNKYEQTATHREYPEEAIFPLRRSGYGHQEDSATPLAGGRPYLRFQPSDYRSYCSLLRGL